VTCPASLTCLADVEIAQKTGSTVDADKCVCCPVSLDNLCAPTFKNKYCKDGQLIPNAVPEQCKGPKPTNVATDLKCPKAVICGAGWTASTTECECCPDLANFTDSYCTTATANELSNLLCSSIGAATSKARPPAELASLIPMSCSSDVTKFPHLALNDFRTRVGDICPLPGTECDSTRPASPAYCKTPTFNV
jgi:hypothetical protein